MIQTMYRCATWAGNNSLVYNIAIQARNQYANQGNTFRECRSNLTEVKTWKKGGEDSIFATHG